MPTKVDKLKKMWYALSTVKYRGVGKPAESKQKKSLAPYNLIWIMPTEGNLFYVKRIAHVSAPAAACVFSCSDLSFHRAGTVKKLYSNSQPANLRRSSKHVYNKKTHNKCHFGRNVGRACLCFKGSTFPVPAGRLGYVCKHGSHHFYFNCN